MRRVKRNVWSYVRVLVLWSTIHIHFHIHSQPAARRTQKVPQFISMMIHFNVSCLQQRLNAPREPGRPCCEPTSLQRACHRVVARGSLLSWPPPSLSSAPHSWLRRFPYVVSGPVGSSLRVTTFSTEQSCFVVVVSTVSLPVVS